ncbi:MAG TPA: hypothetical protein VFS67_01525 [Polyangiaceae bacterium]|jgi:hypothetical protein|nr:hypothetical protein [Polyangiaceae bacterium]
MRLGWFGLLAVSACGGRAQDTTILTALPADGPAEEEQAPAASGALQALAEPAAREAFCGWIGASAANVAGQFGADLRCSDAVDRCRASTSDPRFAGTLQAAAGLVGAAGDLQGVLGCPLAISTLDACLAELIPVAVARYPEGPKCGRAAPAAPLGLEDLATLGSCVQVAVDCPELLRQLLATRG